MTDATRQPLVSVVVCVHNAYPFLREAVSSVLAQTYANLELIVIDDGSTDGSLDAIKPIADSRLRVYRQPHSGKAAALNYALRTMRGEFLIIQDADDCSYPGRVERLVHHATRYPELGAVFSGHDLILGNRRVAPRFASKDRLECANDIANLRMPAHDPTIMFRASAIRGMRFEESLRVGQQYDFILRLGELAPMEVVDACLYSYRVDLSSSATRRSVAEREFFIRLVHQRALERRGQPPLAAGSRLSACARIDNNLAAHFMDSAEQLRASGCTVEAIRVALQCARLRPSDPHYFKALAYAMLPPALTRRIRRRRLKASASGQKIAAVEHE